MNITVLGGSRWFEGVYFMDDSRGENEVASICQQGGNVLAPTEDESAGGLWMLTYEDGFCCSWFPFYASSREEAISYARQLIAHLPYEVVNARLQAYPCGSSVML
jgi:hypothetical protein